MSIEKYRVLIADDEQLTRIGIRYFISMMNDFEVIAEAINGREALEKIHKLNPDIIILDIKMPLCSGIEVLEELHKAHHPSKVILLSGYNDFLYAQQALKYGASDYLLKPTSFENLVETFARVRQAIRDEKTVQDHLKAREKYSSKALSFFLPQFYLKLIRKEFNAGEYTEKKHLFEIPYDEAAVVLVGPDRMFNMKSGSQDTMYDLMVTKINHQINDFIAGKGMKYSNSFLIEKDTFAVIVFREECGEGDVKGFTLLLRGHLSEALNMTVTISIGVRLPLNQASESYDDARRKLKQRFYIGDNRIISDMEKQPAEDKINCPEFEKNILNAIKCQDVASVKKLVDDFFRSQSRLRIPREEWLRFCYEMTLSISNLLENYSMSSEPSSLIDEIGIIAGLSSAHDVKDWLTAIFNDAIKCFQGSVSEQPLIIRKAMKYIEDHYKEHISLAELADYVSLSLNYFSNLFKQSTGKTVLEYITCRRMLEAKRLLQFTQLNVSEIAYELGYVNPRYFSEVFLRNENMTPTQYRKTL